MGSNPTLCTRREPAELIAFGLWLKKRGLRDSAVERKLKFLKYLHGNFEDMVSQVLASRWVDKSKQLALTTIECCAESKCFKTTVPKFRAYGNTEMYVPNPEMIKRLVYRIRNIGLRTSVLSATETAASAGEVLGVTWKDVNLVMKTVTIKGIKGHKTKKLPYL